MKRSGFSKPTPEKIKEAQDRKRLKALEKVKKPANPRTRLKTSKKGKNGPNRAPSVRQLKDKLWNEVKRITRERFPHTCYTCGATNLEGSNLQSGHGKPMGALPLRYKYDIRNIRNQCMRCNIHMGGCQDIFIMKLEQEEEGLAFLNDACYLDEVENVWRIKGGETMGGKDATIFIQNLLQQYKNTHY